MQRTRRVVLAILLAVTVFSFVLVKQQKAENTAQTFKGKIEQIELGDNGFGWTRTSNAVWKTNDSGKNWQEITPPLESEQTLSGISFSDAQNGFVVLSGKTSVFELAKTIDGGAAWTKRDLNLPIETLAEANSNRVWVSFADSNRGWLIVRLTASSNFVRVALFETNDGGASWQKQQELMESGERSFDSLAAAALSEKQTATAEINGKKHQFLSANNEAISLVAPLASDENVTAVDFANASNGWLLLESGRCQNFKSDCEQAARILATSDNGNSWFDATPEVAKPSVKIPNVQSESLSFLPPGGATRISLNRGFDKCTAATAAQMQTWWDNSPFYDSNIYIAGRNRACQQPQLTAAWVNQVSTMGWGLIPTIVGYQAPCSVCTNCQKHSEDPAIAETQGREEADISIAAANNLGLTQGTVLYYDMERYDNPAGTTACSTAVKGFLKGWTDRLKEQGYISGVYGSPTNANNDWRNIPEPSRMDAIWMARWDNIPSVWQTAPAPLPNTFWANHQRIKQYQAPHNETWGGVTFNIDGNISDGPVAAVRAARNKPSDFDGDGKSDIAVFRPDEGNWYVLSSASNATNVLPFGISSDIITPGDYDGDGRTDYSVFRSATGTWYELSFNPARPNAAVNRVRQFGIDGDVPVAADYDGDNITDLAVYRGGVWYITNSFDPRNPNFRVEQFGMSGDLPAPGDYDGDGKADLAVFRPSEGIWYVMRSSNGFYAVQWGLNGDKPVAGDYDGDGKTDVAVWRPADGRWYLLPSTGGVVNAQLGAASDKPAPGDYDGDGKWDPAVFRAETGTWHIQQSQSGLLLTTQFGLPTDRPVASGYIPQ